MSPKFAGVSSVLRSSAPRTEGSEERLDEEDEDADTPSKEMMLPEADNWEDVADDDELNCR